MGVVFLLVCVCTSASSYFGFPFFFPVLVFGCANATRALPMTSHCWHVPRRAVIAQQAADAKGERDVLFGHIYTMTRRLNALEGAAQVEEVAENADPSGCGAAAAGCPAEIVANDASASSSDRTVTVRGGQVLFESDKCAATDLCELQNKVQALMNKFNGTGLV